MTLLSCTLVATALPPRDAFAHSEEDETGVTPGTAGNQNSVFIGCRNRAQTPVLHDRIRINDLPCTSGAFDYGSLMPDDIGRVDNLLNGQCNVITRYDCFGRKAKLGDRAKF